MKTIEDANQDEIRLMKELQAKELVTLRLDFGASMKELSAKYEKRLDELKEDLELRRKMEIHEIEERKNLHINKLVSNHEKAFQEIKEYYYEITKDNLDLIKSLNVLYDSISITVFFAAFHDYPIFPRTSTPN
jgi:adenylosuccinate synthase